jgi:hypothetical protein
MLFDEFPRLRVLLVNAWEPLLTTALVTSFGEVAVSGTP